MSNVERISGWRTTDGQIFNDPTLAEEHQEVVDLAEFLSDLSMVRQGDYPTLAKEILTWLRNRRADE